MKLFLFALFLIAGSLLWSSPNYAQFSGSISGGITLSSNVEGIDTSAPDKIVQPGISLQYLTQFSPITTYKFSASIAPYIYTQTSNHTYYSMTFGLGSSFYLSNQQAIRAEWERGSSEAEPAPTAQTQSTSQTITSPTSAPPPSTSQSSTVRNTPTDSSTDAASSLADSLVANTTSALYLVSGGLDSMEFKGKNSEALSDRRDSASEIVSTLADLLDSLTFSQSEKEVALDEFKDVRLLIAQILSGSKQQERILLLFDQAVKYLNEAQPESDFMPTQGVVLPSGSTPELTPSPGHSTTNDTGINNDEPSETTDVAAPKAPIYTLISATQPFRTLGAQDFDIAADLTDRGATTFASSLQFPLSYEIRINQPFYKIYDYNALTFEGTFESSPSERTALDLTYDLISSSYPNDSVYTNVENQLRLGVRTLLSNSTSLLFEGILGLKKYSTPITTDTVGATKLKKPAAVPSSFFQYSLGTGLVHTIGQDVSVGGLFTFSTNPALRAYVDQIGNLSQRKTAGISDDQYTYNLTRLMGFIQAKVFWGIMLALDLSTEHRKYGSIVKKVSDLITQLTGADRTEIAFITNLGVTKDFTFEEDRALSLFNDIALTFSVGYTTVAAKLPSGALFPLYSYNDTEAGLSLAFGF
jgi:hypothetical protein